MMPEERQRLLDLLDQQGKWCQHTEARDVLGNPVSCDDDMATAWDVTGALFRLFGWERAATLYVQLDKHIHGKRRDFAWPPRDSELDAMAALQEFNDRADVTFELVRSRLESMPVWSGDRLGRLVEPPRSG